ncbi:MAG: dihydrodipicolinate reductase [Pseudomonadota bacterium]
MPTFLIALSLALVVWTSPASAETFQTVNDRASFIDLIKGRELRRLGIALKVSERGQIFGRAFGRQVTGNWQWSDGYFCRDLYYGEEALEPNCQLVEVRGSTVRFTSDRGEGIYADLRLR